MPHRPAGEVARAIEAGTPPVIVFVGTSEEFSAGHIAGFRLHFPELA